MFFVHFFSSNLEKNFVQLSLHISPILNLIVYVNLKIEKTWLFMIKRDNFLLNFSRTSGV
jgi:hypothetical protein